MKSLPAIPIAAAAALSAPLPAHAADLTVVNVSAPAVNCVFNASCTVVVTDSAGTLQYTPLGERRLPAIAHLSRRAGRRHHGLRVSRRPHAGDRLHRMLGRGRGQFRAGRPVDLSSEPAGAGVRHHPGRPRQRRHPIRRAGRRRHHVHVQRLPVRRTVQLLFRGLTAATATLFGFGTPPFVQTDARTPQHVPAAPQNLRVQTN